ncbi:Ureidoglycolate lyase [Peltigera leucophlebia]|nr:Ureidoglycolate lyase [Peltigera leucophlebia]
MSTMSTKKTTSNKTVIHRALTQEYFSPFGTVIENPSPSLTSPILPSKSEQSYPVVTANQDTALKYMDVTIMSNNYDKSPSQKPAIPVMNLFVCFPRALTTTATAAAAAAAAAEEEEEEEEAKEAVGTTKTTTTTTMMSTAAVFPIQVLERHCYTTQTFIPLGLSADSPTRYLVVVAPTLPHQPNAEFPDDRGGGGPPDLDNLRAFWAHGGQAVTYAPGTWHSPMAVIGDKSVDFVVVQYSNGVVVEDCEERKIGDNIVVL